MAEERKGGAVPVPATIPPVAAPADCEANRQGWSPVGMGLAPKAKEQLNASPGEMLDRPGTEAPTRPAGDRSLPSAQQQGPHSRREQLHGPLRGTGPSRATSGGSSGQGEKGPEDSP